MREYTSTNPTGTVYFLLGDHLGSTSVVTDAAIGAVVSQIRYSAYGEERYTSGMTPTDYRYTGQLSRLAEIGLYHYGARWFDPEIAHFVQADTIVPGTGNPLAWDRYLYTLGNPIIYNDPTGHDVGCSAADPKCNDSNGKAWNGKGLSVEVRFDVWRIKKYGLTRTSFQSSVYRAAPDIKVLAMRDWSATQIISGSDKVQAAKDLVLTELAVIGNGLMGASVNGDIEAPSSVSGLSKYQVGSYDELALQSQVGDGLALHHAPPKQAASQVLPNYDPNKGPAIVLPNDEHLNINQANYKGSYNGTPQELFDETLNALATRTGTPPQAFSALQAIWQKLWPGLYR